jgi:hypothetical protein
VRRAYRASAATTYTVLHAHIVLLLCVYTCIAVLLPHNYSGIVGLYTALPLGDVLRQGGELEDVQSVLIDLIREGRRLLNSTYQVSNAIIVESTALRS